MSLRMVRMRAGKSLTETSYGTGIHIGILSKVENGWRDLSPENAALVVEYFGCTREELVATDDEPRLIPLRDRGQA